MRSFLNAVVDGDGSGIVWYTATALEPTEMVVILRSDFEDLVAHRPDFIPTYNLDSWDSVKGRILQRRSHRLGIDSCQQVCAVLTRDAFAPGSPLCSLNQTPCAEVAWSIARASTQEACDLIGR